MRVCLVTEELAFGSGSGGIGGAFHELALLLKRAGHQVDLVYVPAADADRNALLEYYDGNGIRIEIPNLESYAWSPLTYEKKSYALFQYLRSKNPHYDVIHFHDYKGLGFCSQSAKRQRLAFASTSLVVQVHGPTRWALEANDHPFTHEDQLKIDYMERKSIEIADFLVCPSLYMLNWIKQKEWRVPDNVDIIQNVILHLMSLLPDAERSRFRRVRNLVFFGRHEDRKGLVTFCDCIDLIDAELSRLGCQVTFLGRFGLINDDDSAVYLANRSRHWQCGLNLLPDFGRTEAVAFLAEQTDSLVLIPSFLENSPYTVLEAIAAGCPVITSDEGGAKELLDPALVPRMTCKIERHALAGKILAAVQGDLPAATFACPPSETAERWLRFHSRIEQQRATAAAWPSLRSIKPKVVAAITHYERPEKLYDAVLSLASQTYDNLEILIVDDGSSSRGAVRALEVLLPLLGKLHVRLVKQQNSYLGAARNRALAETESEYVIFLDDDDIAFPNMISALVTAAEATDADIVNCINLFMPESRRAEAHPFPDQFTQKASYVPLGGPLSLTPLENVFGSATSLIRRESLEEMGGYTEDYGIGHEDFELYVRAAQHGLHIEVCPLPLYLYEVDRPSMIQATSRLRNWNRVLRSVDVSSASGQWMDLISLVAGRRAREHIENSAAYRRRISPHSDLLALLSERGPATAAYAKVIAEYAERIGALEFAKAANRLATARFATEAESAGTSETLLPPIERVLGRPGSSSKRQCELILNALVDLAFGRISEAIAVFIRSRERSPALIVGGEIQFLDQLCRTPGVTGEQFRAVLATVTRSRLTWSSFAVAAPLVFRLALKSRDPRVALNVLDRRLILEQELGPFNKSRDTDGRDPTAKDDAENSSWASSPVLEVFRKVLGEELGVEPPLKSVRTYVASLAENHQSGGARAPRVPLVPQIS